MNCDVSRQAPVDWDAYVDAHPQGSAYHRSSAVMIGADTFGLNVWFISVRNDSNELTGVLPLVEQSSLLFGKFLVSVPFFTYGGVLSDDGEAAAALTDSAARLARDRRVDHVELRHSAATPGVQLPERLDKVVMWLDLPELPESLSKLLRSKLRSQIKRGGRDDPAITWGGAELVRDFYSVLAPTYHALGTPVYPRRFFDVACRAFGERLSIVTARVDDRVEAAAVLIRHGSRMEASWAAATPAAKRSSLNMRMYWEMLVRSIESGAAVFDFGRSTKDSGTYKFKEQWGAQPQQLHWQYWLPANKAIPMLNHSNAKYAFAAAAWRRMPLWCANLIGPRISRSLP